jgi:hypothetical protein
MPVMKSRKLYVFVNVLKASFKMIFEEVTINRTNFDEEGIVFPDVSSNSVSNTTKEYATFLKLPKQKERRDKGTTMFYRLL